MNGGGRETVPTPIRWALAVAGWIVPGAVRAAWRREWTTELDSENAGEIPGGVGSLVCGIIMDAWTVRRLERRPAGHLEEEGTMTRWGRSVLGSVRSLVRAPAFTLLAVTTLAIGIGTAVAVFSVVDHVLLRPLAYDDADELVVIRHPVPGFDAQSTWPMSVAGYFHLRQRSRQLEDVGNAARFDFTLTDGDRTSRVVGARASASFFEVMRATTVVGRLFDESDDDPGASAVALIAWEWWQNEFGGEDILGRDLDLNGGTVEIVGVLERGFQLPEHRPDVWIPRQLDESARPVNSHYVQVFGRLASGSTVESANRELQAIVGEFAEVMPSAYGGGFIEQARFTGEAVSLRDVVVAGADRPLWAVLGAVLVILVLAAANVANLFLVRAEGRRREIAVRRALGASRGRLVETFLSESMTLAGLAAAAGVGVAALTLPVLRRLAPADFPRVDAIGLDLRSLGASVVVALAVGAVLGLIPLIGARSVDAKALRDGDRSGSRGAGSLLRRGLVATQMALAVVLLSSAALMVRTAMELQRVDPGFDPSDAVAMNFHVPFWEIEDRAEITDILLRGVDRVEAIPGVTAAGLVDQLPMSGRAGCWTFAREGNADDEGGNGPCVVTRFASNGYFAAMGIPLVEGTGLTRAGIAAAGDELVITSGAADRYFEGDAMGRSAIVSRSQGPYHRVSGVISPVRSQGLDQPAPPTFYFPIRPVQNVRGWGPMLQGTVVARTTGRLAMDIVPELRTAMSQEYAALSLTEPRTLEEVVQRSNVRRTFTMTLLAIAAFIATVLGCIGLYGVISYTVSQRRGEIGVRLALGAPASGVTGMVLRDSLVLVFVGALAGLAVSVAAAGLLQDLLFGVTGMDLMTVGSVMAVLTGSATFAAWLPARRAARVDPALSLRGE